ncbi:allantoicase [uncultured Albimonas sp.]|uniref:allantoicase n=1 Tax=uncultured Albimonas sp. TaxID=1331701 RepID=UPI0030EC49F7
MAEEIVAPLPDLPEWAANKINLASPRLGAEAVECSNDFFAEMNRMLQDTPAVFRPAAFDENGKWMDGWESRRRRDSGHDWCVVRLGGKGAIYGVDIDTSFFTGNYPRAASVWAVYSENPPTERTAWTEIIPSITLGPSGHHFVETKNPGLYNWVRLNIFPDGGVARLRVYGSPAPSWEGSDREGVVELSALRNGGRVLGWNDAHYGDVWSILSEGRGRNMGDGWETRRRREPGYDWIIVQLGAAGVVERIEVDTAHFKGNYPDRASIQAADVGWGTDSSVVTQSMFWPRLMPEQKLEADKIHVFGKESLETLGPVTHVKLNIHPDGGISRLRIFGRRS